MPLVWSVLGCVFKNPSLWLRLVLAWFAEQLLDYNSYTEKPCPKRQKNSENHGPRSQLLKHKWPTTRTFFILQQENTSREAGKDPWLKDPLLKNHPHPHQSMAANLLWEFVDGEDKTTVFRICCKILCSEHFIRQMRNVRYQHSPVLITMTEVRSKRFLVCVWTTQLLSQIPISHTLSALCVAQI